MSLPYFRMYPTDFEADTSYHLDHIIPYSRGGKDTKENLCVACASCNLSKGAKTLEEWSP